LPDEVGYEPLNPKHAHVFFQLVIAHNETGSIFLTSNKYFLNGPWLCPMKQWLWLCLTALSTNLKSTA
jgi:hypothetical protein